LYNPDRRFDENQNECTLQRWLQDDTVSTAQTANAPAGQTHEDRHALLAAPASFPCRPAIFIDLVFCTSQSALSASFSQAYGQWLAQKQKIAGLALAASACGFDR
jgi:hypothetical protein